MMHVKNLACGLQVYGNFGSRALESCGNDGIIGMDGLFQLFGSYKYLGLSKQDSRKEVRHAGERSWLLQLYLLNFFFLLSF